MMRQPSVTDHLRAFGETPEWVVSLGEAIYETTQCSAAIAASRARDLSRQATIATGFESLLRGWRSLDGEDFSSLSPMQHETVHLVLRHMLESLRAQANARQGPGADREELSP